MSDERDSFAYKGYFIRRNGDLWDVRNEDTLALIEICRTDEECMEYVDKMLIDDYNRRNPHRPL